MMAQVKTSGMPPEVLEESVQKHIKQKKDRMDTSVGGRKGF